MNHGKDSKERIHDCLLTSCYEYFQEVDIPVEFAAPCAFTLVSTVIGKMAYRKSNKGLAFLNGFRFLVAGPGTGKSLAIHFVEDILDQTQLDIRALPSSMTRASLVDHLAFDQHFKRTASYDDTQQITSGLLLSSEYGVLIGGHTDTTFYHLMCDLWDSRTKVTYSESRRSNPNEVPEIINPYINMLAGTQPAHLTEAFPIDAWKKGYASRCDFYFSELSTPDLSVFDDAPDTEFDTQVPQFYREVAHDLQWLYEKLIKKRLRVMWTPEGREAFMHWAKVIAPETEFTHPVLIEYNARRQFRLWRDCALTMLCRKDRDDAITAEDVQFVVNTNTAAEAALLEHTYRIGSSGDGEIVDKAYSWLLKEYTANGQKPIRHGMFVDFLVHQTERVKVKGIIEHMIEIGALKKLEKRLTKSGNEVPLPQPVYQPILDYQGGLR